MIALESCPGGSAEGYALLARLWAVHGSGPMPEIRREDRGKPYFVGRPLEFSITHTRGRVFCALSHRPIGIDAEALDRRVDLRLADKILSPGERAQYDRAADKPRALLTFWVLKEAAAKRSGEGLRGYPINTDFSLEDPRVRERDGCLLAVLED